MKIKPLWVSWVAIPLLASCAGPPLTLAPVGPGPAGRPASTVGQGNLEVFTETEEYWEDDLSYFPHTDYEVYTANGKRLELVWNHSTHEDEQPAIVTLPPGRYLVKASAEFYGPVAVPVVMVANRTTRVILQPGWKPTAGVTSSNLVQIPNGYFVGWRAPEVTVR